MTAFGVRACALPRRCAGTRRPCRRVADGSPEPLVTWNPLRECVRHLGVHRGIAYPRGRVPLFEGQLRWTGVLLGFGNHLWRGIDAENARFWPTVSERGGQGARPTPQ